MHFAIFVACLVANILANRACSLRLSNIFIATSIFVYYIVPYFTFSGDFAKQCLGLLFTRLQDYWGYYLKDYKITRLYQILLLVEILQSSAWGYYLQNYKILSQY